MMLTIKYFGLVAEATQCSQEQLVLPASCNIKALRAYLYQLHPSLEGKPFKVAVNQIFVAEEQVLQTTDEVALLPPFAGG